MADWDVVGDVPLTPDNVRSALKPYIPSAPVQADTSSSIQQPVGGPINKLAPGIKVLATAPPKPSAVAWRDPTDAEKAAHPGVLQVNSKTGEIKMGSAADNAAPLSDTAKDMLADQYLSGNGLPNTGMGGANIKVDILNSAGDKLSKLGLTGTDLAGKTAEFKANSAALSDAMKRRTQIASYEGTVEDSLKFAQQKADDALANTGFSTANAVVNWYKGETGDAKYKELKDAVDTVTNEYAKVISNATGGGVTSDAARAHAEGMLSAADSPQAFKAAVGVLQQEMQFRINSMDKQIGGLTHALHSAIGAPDQNTADGDYAAFLNAYKAKKGTEYGAAQAWQSYKRTNSSVPWRQAFPDLKPAQSAPASSAPKRMKYNPATGMVE